MSGDARAPEQISDPPPWVWLILILSNPGPCRLPEDLLYWKLVANQVPHRKAALTWLTYRRVDRRPLQCWYLGLGSTRRHMGKRRRYHSRPGLGHPSGASLPSCISSTSIGMGGDPSTWIWWSTCGIAQAAHRTAKSSTVSSVTGGIPSKGSYPMNSSNIQSIEYEPTRMEKNKYRRSKISSWSNPSRSRRSIPVTGST